MSDLQDRISATDWCPDGALRPRTFRCWDHKLQPLQFWEWTYATLLIENDWAENCTGFLVGRRVSDVGDYKIFLVSNKHALPNDPVLREQAGEITLHCNVRGPNGTTVGATPVLPLRFADGSRIWQEHPDPDVDVLAFDVTHLVTAIPRIQWRFARDVDFADKEKLEQWDITIAEDVLVVGYPSGITQGTANLPLVRAGIIATRIGECFVDEVEENGVARPRVVRGFLVDGATVHGSSGSPVVLKPSVGRVVKGTVQANLRSPALLLGIIAETLYAPVTNYIQSFAGLGLAFDAETVLETIESSLCEREG